MTKPTLLIDGDGVLYTAAAAVEREVMWDDQNHVLYSNEEEAFTAVEHIINGYKRELEADKVFIALSGKSVFRHSIFPSYKAGRSRKPLCYAALVEKLTAAYPVKSYPTLEADDLMGIWQTSGKLGRTIIVSADKDMMTIPGELYRGGVYYSISEETADYNWLTQTLTGDVTDGYPGLPGTGAKKAEKVLAVEPTWTSVVQAFVKAGLSEEDALLQARLARILRASDWDSKKQEVILWNP